MKKKMTMNRYGRAGAWASLCGLLACGDTGAGGNTDAGSSTDASTSTSASTTGTGTEPTTGGKDPEEALCQAELQDCPDDFKCVLRRGEADWEFVCLPVQGDNGSGEVCHHDGVIEGTDNCDESSWCIGSFDTTGMPWDGLCYPLCVGMSCGMEERCVGIGALPVCAPVCDPLVAGACGSDEACIYRPPEGFVCFPQGTDGGKIGEVCETGISCESGLHCSQKVAGCGSDEYCCTDYCDSSSDENTCADHANGATCVAIGATEPSQANVGACVIPD